MKVTYDAEHDILRVLFRDEPIAESDEQSGGFIVDYDNAGKIIGIEVLDASKQVTNPQAFAKSA